MAKGGEYLSGERDKLLNSLGPLFKQLGGKVTVDWEDDQSAEPLDLTWTTDLDGVEVPEVPFTVEGVVPAQAVTILYGPGKVGKSLLTLQLALAVATGGEWLGHRVLRPGKAIYLGAEDSPASMHKRLSLILDAQGLTFADVPDLGFKSLLGEDTVLARPGAKGGNEVDFTATYRRGVATVEKERPALLVLDTLNRLTTIDINAAVAAAQFVQRLGELAYNADCAIYLLAHPSLTAMRNGEMSGGSPALFNTARAKHILRRPANKLEGQGVPGMKVFWAEHVNDAPETEPQPNLAGLLGLSANRVSVLAAEGVIQKKGRGRYILAESIQGYAEWVRQNPAGRRRVASDEKERLTAAQADLAELKLAQTRGELLPLEDVRREWAAIAIDLRARLLSISPRVASALGLDRATAARLDAELRSALEDLADQRDTEIEEMLS